MANILMFSMVNHIPTRLGNPPRESDIMPVGIMVGFLRVPGDKASNNTLKESRSHPDVYKGTN